jgi:xanthine dehydrogenase small subunit
VRDHIRFIFRGQSIDLRGFAPTRSVLDWLREDKRATGTKEGCNEGDCGACTAVVVRLENGRLVHRPINTCITFLGMLDGAELLTIEDLPDGSKLHPIQQAMVDHHGSQCGFCTPGIVMSLFAMDKDGGEVTLDRINDQLAGNLCRCTGYRPIIDAALASVGKGEDQFDRASAERMARLEALLGEGALVENGQGFFAAPQSLNELLILYAAHPDATILAGATDVGLWITKQFRPITKLIWLGRVGELKERFDSEGRLYARPEDDKDHIIRIGASVSHEEAMPYLMSISPDLGELGRRFGSKQVRAQGTVGGNIANGSPIGDWAPAFIALDAELELVSAGELTNYPLIKAQEKRSPVVKRSDAAPDFHILSRARPKPTWRRIPLESFFIAYGKQDRQPSEIVSSITIPKLQPGEHFRCFKLSKRFDEDISALMGAFKLTIRDGTITAARIAFGGMAATPKRASATEAALVGAKLDDRTTWQPALAVLATDYQPISDMRASACYRQEAAQALLIKALIEIGGGQNTRLHQPKMMEAIHAS